MLKHERVIKIIIVLFALLALFELFAGSNEAVVSCLKSSNVEAILYQLHNGNSILFNLSVGYLVSTFFWLLVVYIPEQQRRQVLRDNLNRQYQSFKEETIQILLQCAGDIHNYELRKHLCDHHKFREFFDANEKECWYMALNGLQENKERINDLLLEFELLAREIAYVLDNVSIQDPAVHAFFKRLNEHIYRLKNHSVYSYDPVKYLGNFLWSIHARWNIIKGQQDEDIIQEMIDNL